MHSKQSLKDTSFKELIHTVHVTPVRHTHRCNVILTRELGPLYLHFADRQIQTFPSRCVGRAGDTVLIGVHPSNSQSVSKNQSLWSVETIVDHFPFNNGV